MSRRFTPSVVTANALLSGEVVYQTATGEWSAHHHEALLHTNPEAAQAALERAQTQGLVVVGAYLAEARMGNTGPEPLHFREVFRTRGPSNYAHGKQTEPC